MKRSDLHYEFPEELIATEPSRPSRVMWAEKMNHELELSEITMDQLVAKIPAGDVVVINNTKVLKRRVFTEEGLEILFLDQIKAATAEQGVASLKNQWKVLFPSKKYKVDDEIKLPNGFVMTLKEKGRPQVVEVSPALQEADFEIMGELPLPPYIQKARDNRHNVDDDQKWYQTAWAEKPGSFAAPTASLHWTEKHIQQLRDKGVHVLQVTLHVGLGTFLPVTAEDLDQHEMHFESYEVEEKVWQKILETKKMQHKVWALGTTATRTIESVARTNQLKGETNLLLQEGSSFLIVDRLMTNFHQPESTLLAMMAGFYGLQNVKKAYQWAIDKKFKLFSYGDFSVWVK